ncbi:MAG: GAF domain-containing sensor histidine kinase, partial [Anaerolineae bacterium]|nr:GAF domain-containing sensor histidine kinase [Anaerolineae bacterium]
IDHPAFAAFSKDDVDNIELLADIAAEAYRVNRQNERQVRALGVLQQSAKRITDNLTLDDILRETANYAKKIVEREFTSDTDYVSHLAVREGNYLVFRPQHNDPVVYSTFRIAQSERVKFVDPEPGARIGIVGRTAQTGVSQLVPDVRNDEDYFMIRPTGTQLSVPIFVSGQIYGIVSVEHNKPHYFSGEDKDTIETLAAQVGAVITVLNSRFEQARLSERDKQRSLFISNVAHELRTPISQIANFIEGLSRNAYESFDDPDYVMNLPIADRIVKEQRELVDRLLEEARVEGGALKARFSRHDLNQIIRDVVDTYLPRAGEKGIKLNVHIPSDEPLVLSMDRFMIKRAIKNLVDNAIKYTDEGQVVIQLRLQDDHILIDVEDTGIGIPEDEQARIFDRMIRGEDANVYERDGIGIGLDLARRYLELHDGRIVLTRSVKDQGSVFTISLPAKLMSHNLESS